MALNYRVVLQNKGSVRLDYNWQVVMEEAVQASRSVTFAAETSGSRAGSITPSVTGDLPINVPFSIEPAFGSILPGRKAEMKVGYRYHKYSPSILAQHCADFAYLKYSFSTN